MENHELVDKNENIKQMQTTLLLLRKENEILLAQKKKGFGEGKYNGVGGKLEKGETPEQAMIREAQEEIMVTPIEYQKMGEINFLEYYKDEKVNMIFHLYVATNWEGEPQESDEMRPKWFSIQEIPYEKMFQDDTYWLPLVLEGKKIKAFFEFDKDWKMVDKQIEVVDKL